MSEVHKFHGQQTYQVADDEYVAVSEGRIRIRIGVVLFAFMLIIAIVRLAEFRFSQKEKINAICPKQSKSRVPI